MPDWFEDERFWRDWYPYMFSDERYSAAPEEVWQIIELTGRSDGRVLDLACGPGRHAVEFARAGFTVTGVDRTPYLLSKAREHAQRASVGVEWIHEDMREFSRDQSFDLVVNLFTSFGYFKDAGDDQRVLRNVYRSLVPSGQLVLDLMGKELLARKFTPTSSTRHDDGTIHVERRAIGDGWKEIHNQWLLLRDGRYTSYVFSLRLYSAEELRGLLHAAGFSNVDLYGNLEGRPYDAEATRLVAVAQKE